MITLKTENNKPSRSLTESSDTYQTFYHGTAAKNVPSILQKGLIPSFKAGAVPTKSLADDLERLDSVYLTRDIGTAHEVCHEGGWDDRYTRCRPGTHSGPVGSPTHHDRRIRPSGRPVGGVISPYESD